MGAASKFGFKVEGAAKTISLGTNFGGMEPVPGGTGYGGMGGRSHFVGLAVNVDARPAAQMLLDVAAMTRTFPAELMARHAHRWRELIVKHTPVGPRRDLTYSKQRGTLVNANIGLFTEPMRPLNESVAMAKDMARAVEGISGLNRPFASGGGLIGDPAGNRLRAEILRGNAYYMSIIGDEENAASMTLANSIHVELKMIPGAVEGVATSNLYYAWYQEEGFYSLYQPVPFSVKSTDANAGDFYAVHIEQLGDQYPYWPSSGPFINFAKRKVPKFIEGYHMFKKGTEEFEVALSAYANVYLKERLAGIDGRIARLNAESRVSGGRIENWHSAQGSHRFVRRNTLGQFKAKL